VFSDGRVPAKPYKEIAAYSASGGPGDEATAFSKFTESAKKAGANGVILKETLNGGPDINLFGARQLFTFRGAAIVFE
jgi:hypothetical protein